MTSNRSMGSIMLLLVGGLLLAYSAFRSIHILGQTLPADAQMMAYIGLAGLDGGLIAWVLYIITGGARGDTQRAISTLMVVVQLVGVAITSIGDAVLTTDPAGAPGYIRIIVMWGVPAIIAANIVAITAVHLADPRQAIDRAERALRDEIDKQVAERLQAQAQQTAAKVAPQAAEARERELLARYDQHELALAGNGANGHAPKAIAPKRGAQGPTQPAP